MGNIILFPIPPQTYNVETENVRSHLVWIPVTPNVYDEKRLRRISQTASIENKCSEYTASFCEGKPLRFPALWFKGNRRCIFIYFHGNCTDLGDIYEEMYTLSTFLDCNVLAIEYPGYGICSTMSVDPEVINQWGRSAIQWLLKLGASAESIVLFGRSIGTGPAAQTASFMVRRNLQPGGLILHSPFLSIHKVVSDYTYLGTWLIKNHWDIESFLQEISPNTPLLVIHGNNDEVIPVHHGKQLLNQYNAEKSMKAGYFPRDCPHNGYLILDDLVTPIQMFFKERLCFQYQSDKGLVIPLEDTLVPFSYDFNVFSRFRNLNLTSVSNSRETEHEIFTKLNNIKFFSVQVSSASSEKQPRSEEILTAISAFEDIPITQFAEKILSEDGFSA